MLTTRFVNYGAIFEEDLYRSFAPCKGRYVKRISYFPGHFI
jgi:hypothetical protein